MKKKKQGEEGVYTRDGGGGGGGKRLAFRFIVVYDPFGWWNVRNAPCALISTHTIAAGAFVIIHAYALVSVVSFSLAIGFGSARLDPTRLGPCLSAFFLSYCFPVMMYKREQHQLLTLFSSLLFESILFISPIVYAYWPFILISTQRGGRQLRERERKGYCTLHHHHSIIYLNRSCTSARAIASQIWFSLFFFSLHFPRLENGRRLFPI